MSNNVSFLSAPPNPNYSFPYTYPSNPSSTAPSQQVALPSSSNPLYSYPSAPVTYPSSSNSSATSINVPPPHSSFSAPNHPHSLPAITSSFSLSSLSSAVNPAQPSNDIPLSEPLTSFLPAFSQGSPKSNISPPQPSTSAPISTHIDSNTFDAHKQSYASSPYYSNTYPGTSSYYAFGKDPANDWCPDMEGHQLPLSHPAPAYTDRPLYKRYSSGSLNPNYKSPHVDSEAYHLPHTNDLRRQRSYLTSSDSFTLPSFPRDYCPSSEPSLVMAQPSSDSVAASVPSYSTLVSHLPPSPNLTPVNISLPIVSPDSSVDTRERKEKLPGTSSTFFFGTPSPRAASEKPDVENVPSLPSLRDPVLLDDAQKSVLSKKQSPNKTRRSSRSKIQAPRSPGGTSFVCHICQKKFKRSEHLRRHIHSLHTTDKPFVCFCGKRFSRRDNLRQHERMHANSGSYFTRSLKNSNLSPILPPASSIAPTSVPMSVKDPMLNKSLLSEHHPVLLPKVSLFPMYSSADPKTPVAYQGANNSTMPIVQLPITAPNNLPVGMNDDYNFSTM
ncbi:transcription factor Hsr1 [Schizosaccharomyces cryophilus OY26]|uniref:Transcription factor Hsr1 n=1 Tax=Schizosaccharomyces cryophilus (strain OY26 / ATCC MYA-4695 / CBS 11777 / NBRC 106824 / NRRL Y48691) TaxID=653667 RepID=S9X6Z5_SCHCR|nr:transcription factor Hsr1 [Schizosaccharomyces cryophilus OY26]EPY52827.1 transcription factor Hsr1 [Schizosaccharomyces cryophilus OY26]